MNVEIISIGDELLIGKTINTNAAWLGEQLSMLGFTIHRITTISDQKQAIIDSVTKAIKENTLILITGGLGPTNDDITKHILCDLFETELIFSAEAYKNIEKFIFARNGEMNENNKNQALIPKDAIFIPNNCGTASGMWFEKNKAHIISMPGVPFEMIAMMQETIIPRLKKIFTLPTILHRHILLTGIAEAKLAEVISKWENQLPKQIKLAYLPSPGIVKLRLTCTDNHFDTAKKLINNEENKLSEIVGNYIFGYDDETLETLVGELLQKKHATISTAESCTGGNIAHSITQVSGCSNYFIGSIIAYNNSIKMNQLEVPKHLIETYGAVSKEVVESMAQNCKRILKTDYSIATSGIAGPTGGTPEKPIGTVWIAITTPQKTISQKFLFGDNRQRTIMRSTIAALHLLQKNIE